MVYVIAPHVTRLPTTACLPLGNCHSKHTFTFLRSRLDLSRRNSCKMPEVSLPYLISCFHDCPPQTCFGMRSILSVLVTSALSLWHAYIVEKQILGRGQYNLLLQNMLLSTLLPLPPSPLRTSPTPLHPPAASIPANPSHS